MSESRSEFEAWWQEDRLRTWQETGQTRDRGPVPSEHWGEGFRRQSLIAFEAGRRAALESAAKLCEDGWHLLTRHECAEAIRELAGKTKEGQEP
jgi:hypothetical protein